MAFPWAAAATVGGALIGGIASAKGQEDANEANLKIAREQMAFQERMSNTAITRRMADMRRGGINPILAGRYDASSPAGALATMGNVGAAGVQGATAAANTAISANKIFAEADLVREQLKPVMAQIGSVQADTYLKMAQKALARLDANQREAAIALLHEQTEIAKKDALINDVKYQLIKKGLEEINFQDLLNF